MAEAVLRRLSPCIAATRVSRVLCTTRGVTCGVSITLYRREPGTLRPTRTLVTPRDRFSDSLSDEREKMVTCTNRETVDGWHPQVKAGPSPQ